MTVKQFILLGSPGSRVQEHAIALSKAWHLPCITYPALIQSHLDRGTDLGHTLKAHSERGEPIPDKLQFKILRRQLEQPEAMLQGWVLVGFPTTVSQAEQLQNWLTQVGQPLATAVHLKTLTGILMNRLATESSLSTPALRRWLTTEQAAVTPLLDYYQHQSQLSTVNGNLSFEEVAQALFQLGHSPADTARFIKDEAELDALLAQEPLMVVDCMASWCGSCQQVTPLIDQLATAYGDRVNVMKIDFDTNQHIPKRFGLKGMPAVMFFKNGELQETLTGVKPYQAYSAVVSRFLG